jgi:hypothetical protein
VQHPLLWIRTRSLHGLPPGFVVAFSCKGPGGCPSCNGRHMARDRGRPRRSRHPAGARAAVGDLRTQAEALTLAAAMVSRRPACGRQGPARGPCAAALASAPPAAWKQARGVRPESQAQAGRDGTGRKGMSARGAMPRLLDMRRAEMASVTAATHTTNRPRKGTQPLLFGTRFAPEKLANPEKMDRVAP